MPDAGAVAHRIEAGAALARRTTETEAPLHLQVDCRGVVLRNVSIPQGQLQEHLLDLTLYIEENLRQNVRSPSQAH
jgi:hypothetical protein